MNIDTAAPVIARHTIDIAASLEAVWKLHSAVNEWTAWQPDIASATMIGPFAAGNSFRWLTHGLDITSTVYEVQEPRLVVWGGMSRGITGIHRWSFLAEGDHTIAHTEESWDGDPIRADVASMQSALDQSLRAWLRYLKATAER